MCFRIFRNIFYRFLVHQIGNPGNRRNSFQRYNSTESSLMLGEERGVGGIFRLIPILTLVCIYRVYRYPARIEFHTNARRHLYHVKHRFGTLNFPGKIMVCKFRR